MINGENNFTGLKKGLLIVHEGISGSGKSESVRKMVEYLRDKGYKTAIVEWNSNVVIRKIIHTMNRMKILSPIVYSFLQFTAFFINYITKVIRLLNKNYIVIADRYIYTAFTRDAANGVGISLDRILYRFARKPDLLFFHNTPPKVCFERIQKRGKVLFHINKGILKNRALKNKDLYYLKKLNSQYLKVLNDFKSDSDLNIIVVNNDLSLIPRSLEYYLKTNKLREEYAN